MLDQCTTSLIQRTEGIKSHLKKWRQHFHRYPELSFQEKETSEYIIRQLELLDVFTIETGVAKYGVIATLSTGDSPTFGLRADMDALPIVEKTDLPYASEYPGIMHACGHDAHMAILLGVATIIAEDYKKGDFKGTVKLIFQPAEEDTDSYGKTGAPYFIESGVVENLDAVLALHMCPWQETGSIQLHKGASMANIDNFVLKINGKGAHGGYPHESKDPIWMLSFILQGLYGLISRKLNPLEAGTISIGQINGGQTPNVIPDTVEIRGTIRSYSDKVRQQLIEEINQVAQMVYSFSGGYELEIEKGEPALDNNPALIDLIEDNAQKLYPLMKIISEPYGLGGEDFGHFTKVMPGAMFFLGCAKAGDTKKVLHASDFIIDEEAMPIGVAILTATLYQGLKEESKITI